MTIRKRPWEKALDYEIRVRKELGSSLNTHETKSIPHVVVDGVSFYSDRFYLNTWDNTNTDTVSDDHSLPPLFDRTKLLKNLSLKAIILSTYTYDTTTVQQMLQQNTNVPCLILHGQRNPSIAVCGANRTPPASGKRNHAQDLVSPKSYQQPVYSCPACDTDDDDDEEEEELEEQDGPAPKSSLRHSTKINLPNNVFFTQILPSWNPPSNTKRQVLPGVHHPKYMLLFETDGSLIVVVSTANLTPPTCVDASWIQRFPPARQGKQNDAFDFGPILFDFLEKQSLAAATATDDDDDDDNNASDGNILPSTFLQRHLQNDSITSIQQLQQHFDFSHAQVQLVSTVPGTHTHSQGKISYGPQRVADILAQVQAKVHAPHSNKHWLPHSILSDLDRLVVQSTSWGASPWNGRDMVQLFRMYLGWEPPIDKNMYDSQDLLDRIDILWPTQDFMTKTLTTATTDVNLGFFTSRTFNDTDLACISRMAKYEPKQENFVPSSLAPHIKTMIRLLDRPCNKDMEDLAWILLTSACFSRGAQGMSRTKYKNAEDTLSFTNFELGVFFCSRMQGFTTDRIYRCIRNTSDVVSVNPGPRIIHIPIPFYTRPRMYQDKGKRDDDDMDAFFSERPYFHEIVHATVGVGHMTLIP